MHIEYSHLVKLAVQKLGETSGLFSSESQGFEFEAAEICSNNSFGLVDIELCPSPECGDVATPVAYRIAKWAKRAGVADFSNPEFVVTELSRAWSELDPNREMFSVSVGGAGFVNGTANKSFYLDFFEQVIETEANCLFSSSSCLSRREVAKAQNENILSGIQADRGLIMERLKASRDDDVVLFVQTFKDPTYWTEAQLLMGIGLVASRELMATPFLQGVRGSQNVPWFLERYREAVRSLSSLSANRTVSDSISPAAACSSAAYSAIAADSEGTFDQRQLANVAKLLLSFRFELAIGPSELIAVRALRWSLAAAKSFFAFYNFPGNRIAAGRIADFSQYDALSPSEINFLASLKLHRSCANLALRFVEKL